MEDAFSALAPNKFQTDFKDSYFRLSLLDRALSGEIVKVFPLLNDENNKWYPTIEALQTFIPEDAQRLRTIAVTNQKSDEIVNPKGEDGKYLKNVVLDLDYTVVIPKRKTAK